MSDLTKVCPQCKESFPKPYNESLRAWQSRHIYCGRKCYVESMRGKAIFTGKRDKPSWRKGKKFPELSGPNNPLWARVEKSCLQCKNSFLVKNYRKQVAKFCSHKCSSLYRDEGKTELYKKIRKSFAYKQWCKTVFDRDDYTCQVCGQRGGRLHADHIQPFALFPELRLAVTNGRTLCVDCHKKTPTYGVNKPLAAVTEA